MIPVPVAPANENPALAETGFLPSQTPPSSSEVPQSGGDPASDIMSSASKWYRDCPRCGKNDGVLDSGPVCLGHCDSCKTFWFAGRNLYHAYYPSCDRTWSDLDKTDHVLDAYEFVMGLMAGAA